MPLLKLLNPRNYNIYNKSYVIKIKNHSKQPIV